MKTFVLLAIITLAAVLLGWLINLHTQRLQRRWMRLLVSFGVTVLSFFFAIVPLNNQKSTIPATDNTIFRDRNTYSLEGYAKRPFLLVPGAVHSSGPRVKPINESTKKPSKSSPDVPDVTATLIVPTAVRLKDEVAVDLIMTGMSSKKKVVEFVSTLEVGEGIASRTSSQCDDAANADTKILSACSKRTMSGEARFRWIVSSNVSDQ